MKYKVLHLKPNGAHVVSPLPRPCWILPIPAAFMRAHGLAVCTLQYYTGHLNRRLTLQQRIFVCKCYFKWEIQAMFAQSIFRHSLEKCLFPDLQFTRLWKNSKPLACKHIVLTEETLDEIGASLERTPTKSILKLAQQVGISESSAHRATKLLKVKPYKCTSVHSLKQDDPVSRML